MQITNTAAIKNNDNRIELEHFAAPEVDIGMNKLSVTVMVTDRSTDTKRIH